MVIQIRKSFTVLKAWGFPIVEPMRKGQLLTEDILAFLCVNYK